MKKKEKKKPFKESYSKSMDYRKFGSPGRRWFSSTSILKECYLAVSDFLFLFLSSAWIYAGFLYVSVYRTAYINIFQWNGCRGIEHVFLLWQNCLHICLLFGLLPFQKKFFYQDVFHFTCVSETSFSFPSTHF